MSKVHLHTVRHIVLCAMKHKLYTGLWSRLSDILAYFHHSWPDPHTDVWNIELTIGHFGLFSPLLFCSSYRGVKHWADYLLTWSPYRCVKYWADYRTFWLIFTTPVLVPIYFVYSSVSIYWTFTRFIGQWSAWLAVSHTVYMI